MIPEGLIWIILIIMGILVIFAIAQIVEIFLDDRKLLLKIQSEFFEKGMKMGKDEIISRIEELNQAIPAYKKKFKRSSYKLNGKKRGLEEALKIKQ